MTYCIRGWIPIEFELGAQEWGTRSPYPPPALNQAEVHLWLAHLDTPVPVYNELKEVLGDDELVRAERFRSEQDRRRYVIAHGWCRVLVAGYMGIAPEAVQFNFGDKGKPVVVAPSGSEEIRFNLSHSRDWALYGFSRDQSIGVDLERMRPGFSGEVIAQRFFPEQETTALLALPAAKRQERFYGLWTRKEAYLKATGEGLSASLRSLAVPRGQFTPSGSTTAWTIRDLYLLPEFAAAVAVAGTPKGIHGWRLSM